MPVPRPPLKKLLRKTGVLDTQKRPFFLRSEELLADPSNFIKQTATAKEWRSWLKQTRDKGSTPGVTEDELMWANLDELLDGDPERVLTRQELFDHVRNHPLRPDPEVGTFIKDYESPQRRLEGALGTFPNNVDEIVGQMRNLQGQARIYAESGDLENYALIVDEQMPRLMATVKRLDADGEVPAWAKADLGGILDSFRSTEADIFGSGGGDVTPRESQLQAMSMAAGRGDWDEFTAEPIRLRRDVEQQALEGIQRREGTLGKGLVGEAVYTRELWDRRIPNLVEPGESWYEERLINWPTLGGNPDSAAWPNTRHWTTTEAQRAVPNYVVHSRVGGYDIESPDMEVKQGTIGQEFQSDLKQDQRRTNIYSEGRLRHQGKRESVEEQLTDFLEQKRNAEARGESLTIDDFTSDQWVKDAYAIMEPKLQKKIQSNRNRLKQEPATRDFYKDLPDDDPAWRTVDADAVTEDQLKNLISVGANDAVPQLYSFYPYKLAREKKTLEKRRTELNTQYNELDDARRQSPEGFALQQMMTETDREAAGITDRIYDIERDPLWSVGRNPEPPFIRGKQEMVFTFKEMLGEALERGDTAVGVAPPWVQVRRGRTGDWDAADRILNPQVDTDFYDVKLGTDSWGDPVIHFWHPTTGEKLGSQDITGSTSFQQMLERYGLDTDQLPDDVKETIETFNKSEPIETTRAEAGYEVPSAYDPSTSPHKFKLNQKSDAQDQLDYYREELLRGIRQTQRDMELYGSDPSDMAVYQERIAQYTQELSRLPTDVEQFRKANVDFPGYELTTPDGEVKFFTDWDDAHTLKKRIRKDLPDPADDAVAPTLPTLQVTRQSVETGHPAMLSNNRITDVDDVPLNISDDVGEQIFYGGHASRYQRAFSEINKYLKQLSQELGLSKIYQLEKMMSRGGDPDVPLRGNMGVDFAPEDAAKIKEAGQSLFAGVPIPLAYALMNDDERAHAIQIGSPSANGVLEQGALGSIPLPQPTQPGLLEEPEMDEQPGALDLVGQGQTGTAQGVADFWGKVGKGILDFGGAMVDDLAGYHAGLGAWSWPMGEYGRRGATTPEGMPMQSGPYLARDRELARRAEANPMGPEAEWLGRGIMATPGVPTALNVIEAGEKNTKEMLRNTFGTGSERGMLAQDFASEWVLPPTPPPMPMGPYPGASYNIPPELMDYYMRLYENR